MAKKTVKTEQPKDVNCIEKNGQFYPITKKDGKTYFLCADGFFTHEGYEKEGFTDKESAEKAFAEAIKTFETNYVV